MDKVVEILLEKETMSGDEFREILGRYVELPKGVEPDLEPAGGIKEI